eukprot:comp16367_c0_seq1/m.14209 comp16367_c0_seq1/g.14209  ORF comp16367_c0_seq1/g.14209 comp16367_c0_seq1/m.14209 type:complete len:133 (-) comp16367_c0_seq1:163-561(-)
MEIKDGAQHAEADPAQDPRRTFNCHLCGLKARVDYYGRKPFFAARQVVLYEDAYVMRNPFGAGGEGHLVLGANCTACSRPVCVGCSTYYTRRYCNTCMAENIRFFPLEIQKEFARKAPKPTPSSEEQGEQKQ